MKIYKNVTDYCRALETGELPYTCSAVTLGKFDGIHLGHQKLLHHVKNAAAGKMNSVVFAIDIKQEGILSHEERADFLEKFGVDVLIEYPFSKEFMLLSPLTFLSDILIGQLKAAHIVVGVDYRFGRDREGDADFLVNGQKKYHYTAQIIEKEVFRGKDISSTRVRSAINRGDLELAAALLGRPYPVSGIVVHGNHIGSTIGVPTANVIPSGDKILPPNGVYLSVTELSDGRCIPGISNLGTKPTVGDNRVGLETNLFSFEENIYGTKIRTGLLQFIREEKRFESLQHLLEQMNKDTNTARNLIKNNNKLLL